MLTQFIKDNLIALIITGVLQLAVAGLKLENNSLELEVANLNTKIQEYTLKVSTLESSNSTLQTVIDDNNQRIKDQSDLQTKLIEQGQQASALAAKNSKDLAEQIQLLKSKLPKGETECERVFSVLQDL